jgi:hypothetical protein
LRINEVTPSKIAFAEDDESGTFKGQLDRSNGMGTIYQYGKDGSLSQTILLKCETREQKF